MADGNRGQFFAVHSIATDSKTNIYTTETYEEAPQKIPQGWRR